MFKYLIILIFLVTMYLIYDVTSLATRASNNFCTIKYNNCTIFKSKEQCKEELEDFYINLIDKR